MIKKLTHKELEEKANTLRQEVIKMLVEAGTGHAAGPLGMADVFATLYFHVLNHNPENPKWESRDRVFLSNGHICPIWYVTLAEAGYFSKDELTKLRDFGSILQGHPNRFDTPGVENSSGPLGQGISQAVGAAIAAKMDKRSWWTYCVMGDGEQNEGQVWEAYMLAAKQKLNNLTIIIDRNSIQIDGYTEEVMPLEPFVQKLEAFGLHTIEIDGHNVEAIIDACDEAKAVFNKPSVIIANTIPGKSVDFMERLPEWHGQTPDLGEAVDALEQLRTLKGKIEI